jgi:hypothetical protein
MKTDVLLSMPPSAFVKVPNVRMPNLNDVPEEDEGGRREGHGPYGGKKNHVQQLAFAENGHAHSLDTATDNNNGSPAASPRRRSQSAKRPSTSGVNGETESAQLTRSHTTLPPSKPPKSAGNANKGWKRRKAFASKERKEDGGSTPRDASHSPQRRVSRADSDVKLPAANAGRDSIASLSNAAMGRQGRRRLRSRPDDGSQLSDSFGEVGSPRLNGTLSSDASSDDFPRYRQQSPTNGMGIKEILQGGPEPSSPPLPPTGPRLWDMFEDHVRTIHDSSDMFSRQQGGPSFRASNTFQDTMKDLFGYTDYSHPPKNEAQSAVQKHMSLSGAAHRFMALRKRSTLTAEAPKPKAPPDRKTIENAKRGWRILKQYVHDNYLSKRTSGAALAWSMLRQTLKGKLAFDHRLK